MAKILIMANKDIGLYKFRKELIEELVKDHKVYVAIPNGDFIPMIIELGCEFIDIPISRRGTNPLSDLRLLMKYIMTIKEIKPDVVLTYTIKPNVYGGLASKINNIPYIVNITGLGTAVENTGFLQHITLFLYKMALSKVKCVFFQNKENLLFFRDKGIAVNKEKLIPGSGVNLQNFGLIDYPDDERIEFLFIARIMKEKGIDQYLEAAEFIKLKYPNTVFHILGNCEESYVEKLRDMQNKGIIIYHGRQDDVRKFMKISHCTIHPTYYPEGMSNVLLESAACGRPIITTDRAGCREIVEEGKTGYIVEQKNSGDLIDRIEDFLELSYKDKMRMGLAGREKVEKEFDRQIVVDAYMDEINKEVILNGL